MPLLSIKRDYLQSRAAPTGSLRPITCECRNESDPRRRVRLPACAGGHQIPHPATAWGWRLPASAGHYGLEGRTTNTCECRNESDPRRRVRLPAYAGHYGLEGRTTITCECRDDTFSKSNDSIHPSDYLRVQGDTIFAHNHNLSCVDYLRVQGGHRDPFWIGDHLVRLPASAGALRLRRPYHDYPRVQG